MAGSRRINRQGEIRRHECRIRRSIDRHYRTSTSQICDEGRKGRQERGCGRKSLRGCTGLRFEAKSTKRIDQSRNGLRRLHGTASWIRHLSVAGLKTSSDKEGMMKRFHVAALVFAVLALAATASAQSSTSQFVVGGETAKKIHDFGTINLATAERIAEKCEDLARKEGVAVSIYILDNEGNHVYMHRMDGQGYLNIVTAEMKARTALLTRARSKARMNQVLQ